MNTDEEASRRATEAMKLHADMLEVLRKHEDLGVDALIVLSMFFAIGLRAAYGRDLTITEQADKAREWIYDYLLTH